MTVETDWADVRLTRGRLGRGVRGARPRHPAQRGPRPGLGGAAHDPRRQRTTARSPTSCSGSRCGQNRELLAAFNRAWPLLEATDVVGDLWSVPAYLRRCAPWLGADEVRLLQRADAQAWTVSDLPFLDAARQRLGDPETLAAPARQEAAVAAERERMSDRHRRPDRDRRLRAAADDDAAPPGPAGRPGRPGRAAHRRPGPARRPVRAHRRRRGAGADRRGVADAAAALPVAELHRSSATAPRPGTGSPSRGRSGSARIGLDRTSAWPR